MTACFKKTFAFCVVLLILLSVSTICFADYVPLHVAENVAVNWIRKISDLPISTISIANVYIEMDEDVPVYYIFNIIPSGFVIISADDASHPILGYSPTGFYSEDNLPPAFNEWMHYRKSEIIEIIK
jgi:hypothetical protein